MLGQAKNKAGTKRRADELRKKTGLGWCMYCWPSSATDNDKKRAPFMGPNCFDLPKEIFFARCCTCGSLICSKCINKAYYWASTKAKQQPIMQRLCEIYSQGMMYPIPLYDGGCCMLKEKRNETMYCNGDLVSAQKRIKDATIAGNRNIGGFLHIPQYNVFVDSPNDSIDMHGFGGEDFDPVLHCVPNENCVAGLAEKDVYPSPLPD